MHALAIFLVLLILIYILLFEVAGSFRKWFKFVQLKETKSSKWFIVSSVNLLLIVMKMNVNGSTLVSSSLSFHIMHDFFFLH